MRKQFIAFLAAAMMISSVAASGAFAGFINTFDDQGSKGMFTMNGLKFKISLSDILSNDKINKRGKKAGVSSIAFLGLVNVDFDIIKNYKINKNGKLVITFKNPFMGTLNVRYAAQGKNKKGKFLGEVSRSKIILVSPA